MKAYARKVCDYNYNEFMISRINEYKPKDQLYIDEIIKVWTKDVESRLPKIKEVLAEKEEYLKVIEEFEKTFMFAGY